MTNVPSFQDVPTENASEVPILAFVILIGMVTCVINLFASKSIRFSSPGRSIRQVLLKHFSGINVSMEHVLKVLMVIFVCVKKVGEVHLVINVFHIGIVQFKILKDVICLMNVFVMM